MDVIEFLNVTFFKDSSYFVLLVLSICFIFLNKNKTENMRGKRMALYAVLVMLLIIWNPIVAPIGLLFFGEDIYAYMRIFYLIPLMSILAYAGTEWYTSHVVENERKGRKTIFAGIIAITVILSGRTFNETMYRDVTNIYKIDQDAYEISNLIMSDCGNTKVRVCIPQNEEILYGIRQYEGNIIIAGDSQQISSWDQLYLMSKEYNFDYIVLPIEEKITDFVEAHFTHSYELVGDTENYKIFRRVKLG